MKPTQIHLSLQNRKLWAIIPAAGSGSRFSKTALKQYQMIDTKTVLEHTVERLNYLPLAGYVLAIGEQDDVAQTLNFSEKQKALFCLGGKERVDSVLSGLNYLMDIADDHDLVLVHDAARPCVSEYCLKQLIQSAVQDECSAILATPVRDTLKLVSSSDFQIDKTVSRDRLWQAQTPQISTLAKLKYAIEKALKDDIVITDEASALEYVGEKVNVVAGRSDNIKITYADDLDLAKLILKSQNIEK